MRLVGFVAVVAALSGCVVGDAWEYDAVADDPKAQAFFKTVQDAIVKGQPAGKAALSITFTSDAKPTDLITKLWAAETNPRFADHQIMIANTVLQVGAQHEGSPIVYKIASHTNVFSSSIKRPTAPGQPVEVTLFAPATARDITIVQQMKSSNYANLAARALELQRFQILAGATETSLAPTLNARYSGQAIWGWPRADFNTLMDSLKPLQDKVVSAGFKHKVQFCSTTGMLDKDTLCLSIASGMRDIAAFTAASDLNLFLQPIPGAAEPAPPTDPSPLPGLPTPGAPGKPDAPSDPRAANPGAQDAGGCNAGAAAAGNALFLLLLGAFFLRIRRAA